MLLSVTSSLFSVYPTESIAVLELRNPRIDVFQLQYIQLVETAKCSVGYWWGGRREEEDTYHELFALTPCSRHRLAGRPIVCIQMSLDASVIYSYVK